MFLKVYLSSARHTNIKRIRLQLELAAYEEMYEANHKRIDVDILSDSSDAVGIRV